MHNISLALALWLLISAAKFGLEIPNLRAQADHSGGYHRARFFVVGQDQIGRGNFGDRDSLLRVKAGTY